MSRKRLLKNIGSMSIAVFISRILGLIRDIFMTNFFGTTYVADAFQVSYQIPNLLRKLFGEGALSAAFIPIYNDFGLKNSRREQIRFALNIISILSLVLLFLCILGILLAPLILRILAPGFDEKTFQLAIRLTRILFPYLFLIGISSTLISILNSHDRFFIPGLSSAFLNIGMIGSLGIFVLINKAASIEAKIVIWSYGVILGGFLQMIINFPLLKKLGYSLKIVLQYRKQILFTVWKRFLPGVFGLAIREINLAVDLILASLLMTGSIAALNYGNRLMQLPMGIIGISAGVAALPMFSRLASEKRWIELQKNLHLALLTLAYLMIPITVILIGTGKDIIRLLFMRGVFDERSLDMTYKALIFYSFGLIFYAFNRLIIPLFYANKDTQTPVKISAVIVCINIILNVILMQFLQHAGLAFASSITAGINFFILKKYLAKYFPEIVFPKIGNEILKLVLLSLFLLVFIYLINFFLVGNIFWLSILKIILSGFSAILIMLIGSKILNMEFSETIRKRIWQRFLRR